MKTRSGPCGKRMVAQRAGTAAAFQLSPASSSMSTTATTQLSSTYDATAETQSEVDRLRTMAAKLRTEAASMDAEKGQEQVDVTQRALAKFDTNVDCQVSLDELKAGLAKARKTDLEDDRVKRLMEEFDVSGGEPCRSMNSSAWTGFAVAMRVGFATKKWQPKNYSDKPRWMKKQLNWLK
jgi:hypothetical protein